MLHIHENEDGTFYISIITENLTFCGNFARVESGTVSAADGGLVINLAITATTSAETPSE